MSKISALQKLRKAFGQPEEGDFDPELFLLRLQKTISDQTKAVQEEVKKLYTERSAISEAQAAKTDSMVGALQKLLELQGELKQAIIDRKIEKVTVERVVETPPSKINVNVDLAHPKEAPHWLERGLIAYIKQPVDSLVSWLTDALASIRRPDGAIAVKLVDPQAESFYRAVFNVMTAGGGGANIDVSSLATEATLLLVKAKTDNLDIAISALRDALSGAGNKTLTDIVTALAAVAVAGTNADAAAVTGIKPVLISGRYDSSDRAVSNGDMSTIALDAEGRQLVTKRAATRTLGDARSNVIYSDREKAGNDIEYISRLYGFNGSDWDRIRMTIANGLLVDVSRIVAALPAGTNLLGRVSASSETTTIYEGTTALTPKFVNVDLSASGDLIASVSSKKLRIVAGFLTVAADTTLKFQSNASTDLTGAMTIKAGGGFVWPFNPVGYIQTVAGEKLNLVMGTSVQVSGSLTYVEAA